MPINDNDVIEELNDLLANFRDLKNHLRGDQIPQNEIDDLIGIVQKMKEEITDD